jgi:rare lipoprotein A
MIRRLRRSGVHKLVAIAFAALTSSGPVKAAGYDEPVAAEAAQAAELQGGRIASLQDAVADLEDPALRTAYEAIGQGEASYYGAELAGNRTASGERFNPAALTAAHRSLPLGTKLRVTNMANGMSVIVRVNDRGPFVGSRIIDVSLGAARQIGMVRTGKARVRLEILRTIA